jgi:hypothetical protein
MGKKYQMTANDANTLKLYQMAVKYSKWALNVSTFSIPMPSGIYSDWDFWFENKPSGNPGLKR